MSYYKLKITGKNVKRFIHNLHKMHIELFELNFSDNYVIIKVNEQDYKKILNIKTIYDIEVIEIYGGVYIKYFIKKYFVFLCVLLIGLLLFIGFTNVIFNIEVIHNNKEIREIILDELEMEGIKKYNFVVSYEKKEKIKKNILNKYKDKIDWIEIDRIGTKYEIKVEERKKNNEIIDNKPSNIVAKKSGLIKKIVASSGEIIVKKDQYVKQGDVLISGVIHNKEEVVGKIRANGLVFAETWYNVTVEVPLHYYEEKKTGNSQKVLNIKWFNKNINLFGFKNFKNSKYNNIYSLENNILPISISIVNEEEINVIDKVFTKDNVVTEASLLAKKRLKDRLGENIEILYEKNLKIVEENSKIIVVMFFKVYEDITSSQEIKEEDINNLNQEIR